MKRRDFITKVGLGTAAVAGASFARSSRLKLKKERFLPVCLVGKRLSRTWRLSSTFNGAELLSFSEGRINYGILRWWRKSWCFGCF